MCKAPSMPSPPPPPPLPPPRALSRTPSRVRPTQNPTVGAQSTRSTVVNPSGIPMAMRAQGVSLGGTGTVLGG